jgi:rfaE bifunctional protein nucleotidyltransferase chain/domain
MGGRGARIYPADGPSAHIPVPEHATAAPAAADVCGAGDRFTVAAAAALAGGATPAQAVASAVSDAARFVAAGGAAAVSTPAPAQNMENISAPGGFDETATLDAFAHAERLRRAGRTVVATGGCFDLLHTGHIRMLHRARQLGDALIVLVNSDASVRRLKGPDRPVMAAADRARVLAALACVDAVAVFDAATPERALERLRPDVWVKGGDYTVDQLPEADVVTRHGGEVVILPTIAGYSSSNLIAAARTSHGRT